MHEILFGGLIAASFIGGVIALFAPCCISVMLPAYFASSFQRGRALLTMTFVFALGLAAVILPIAVGATAVTRFVTSRHGLVFLVGGLMMIGLGLATLAGWRLPLPMPGGRARTDRGPRAVFALGVFSGVASSCCAPVLAGVVAVSGSSGSFLTATLAGTAFVFGMVAPLFVMAVLWDRYDWSTSVLLRGRSFELRAFGRRWRLHSTSLFSGVLLLAMGVLTLALAATGPFMPRDGWQVRVTAWLQHVGARTTSALAHLPGWITAAAVFATLAAVSWKAIVQCIERDDRLEKPEGEPASPALLGSAVLDPSPSTQEPTDAHTRPRSHDQHPADRP